MQLPLIQRISYLYPRQRPLGDTWQAANYYTPQLRVQQELDAAPRALNANLPLRSKLSKVPLQDGRLHVSFPGSRCVSLLPELCIVSW
jgi:hypothetical protein